MGRTFKGKRYDPDNISGQTLAKIGRLVLEDTGDKPGVKFVARSDVTDYESLKWLDDRINEVLLRGKI